MKFEVKLDSNKLDQYYNLFDNNDSWTALNRAVRLSDLLDDTINNTYVLDGMSILGTVKENFIDVADSCFMVEKMTLTVVNSLITKLVVDVKILKNTYLGGVLNNMYGMLNTLTIVQKISGNSIHFYIKLPE
jgi:hypothetical protein